MPAKMCFHTPTYIYVCFILASHYTGKYKRLGFKSNQEDSAVKQWLLSATGLAFVPPCDIVGAIEILFDALNDENNDDFIPHKDVVDYLDKTYIRGRPVCTRRRGGHPPRYLVEMWNVYERTMTDEARTNNAVECWHNKFNKMVNKRRLSMFSLLDEL